LLVRVQL